MDNAICGMRLAACDVERLNVVHLRPLLSNSPDSQNEILHFKVRDDNIKNLGINRLIFQQTRSRSGLIDTDLSGLTTPSL